MMISYKIELKKATINYSKDIYNLIDTNRMYLANYLNWINLTKTEEDTKIFFKKKILEHKNDVSKTFIILFNNICVGVIGFNSINYTKKEVYFGYWISPIYEGNGIIYNSIYLLINIFKKKGIKNFFIKCAIHNIKSNYTAVRAGFKKVEYIKSAEKINNIYYDQNLYLKMIEK